MVFGCIVCSLLHCLNYWGSRGIQVSIWKVNFLFKEYGFSALEVGQVSLQKSDFPLPYWDYGICQSVNYFVFVAF